MNYTLDTPSLFRTSDISLAGVIALNIPVHSVDRSEGRKVYFLFENQDGLDQLIELYHQGHLNVEPRRFSDMIRHLKSRIYSDETENLILER